MSALLAPQPPEWTRDDWLRWRREGVGGSDVAALCGLSRFASPMSVFVDKLELGTPQEPNEAMLWGQLLEGPIAREFEAREGLHVVHPQTLAVDPVAPWRRCTLDGIVAESPDLALDKAIELGLGDIQIKCSSSFGFDEVPEEYAVQVHWELGVTGFERGWLVVLHVGRRLVVYPIEFDARVFAALCSIADRFFHEHVKTQMAPPTDGSEATTQALKAAFADGTGAPVELSSDVVETAKEWPAAKARVKEAEADLDRIENRLRSALGDAVAGVIDVEGLSLRELVTWKPQNADRIDAKALRVSRPEVAREFTITTTSRVLRPTKHLLELIRQEDQHQGATP